MVDDVGEYVLTMKEARAKWGYRITYAFMGKHHELHYYEDPYCPTPVTDIKNLEHKLNESIVRMHQCSAQI